MGFEGVYGDRSAPRKTGDKSVVWGGVAERLRRLTLGGVRDTLKDSPATLSCFGARGFAQGSGPPLCLGSATGDFTPLEPAACRWERNSGVSGIGLTYNSNNLKNSICLAAGGIDRGKVAMNPQEILRIVDAIHRDKNIDKEIVFEGIEAALVSAAKKHYGEEANIVVNIDREDGSIRASNDGVELDSEETVGRIGAQTAKQVMIQKIREAERDALYDEYNELVGQMVSGVIQRYEGGAATVQLTNVEAILPRGEQIPGETHHVNERVRTTVFEVRKAGSRVKVIFSRARPQLVQRLFEQEIPEIADGVIQIRAMAREPGYRSKVAGLEQRPARRLRRRLRWCARQSHQEHRR